MRKSGIFKALTLTVLAGIFLLVGCGNTNNNGNKGAKEWGEQVEKPKELPTATIVVKDYGTIVAELYPQYAPNTVNNFISLANSGFYDGLTFHRVIKDFVLQGGDSKGDGTGGPGYSIKGEFSSNGYKYNTLTHSEGVLSMARSKDNNSAGSQFFIVTENSDRNTQSLDNLYAGFGKVTEGIDVVKKIANVSTDPNDKPKDTVIIESIKIDTKGIEYKAPEKM